MKILITGAAGFIGYHLTKSLVQKGYDITTIDSINTYYDTNLKYERLSNLGIERHAIHENIVTQSIRYPLLKFIQLNIADVKVFPNALSGADFNIVIHLAAQAGVRYSITNPQAYLESNMIAFANILEYCRHTKVKHLIYASSSSVYGNNPKVPFLETDNTDYPVSLYAATKKSNELMAHTYSHLYDIPVTGLRFFTVYGPWGRPDMSPILFAKAILDEQPIKVFNNGNLKRDFTYVDDVIDGIVLLLDAPPPIKSITSSGQSIPPYRIFNIGNNRPVQLLHFIDVLEQSLQKKAIKEMLPMQQGDVYETYANINALHELTGYEPKTSIEQGLPKFVEWFRSFYNL
jgi:UDP-glucuronate 4-epimerase